MSAVRILERVFDERVNVITLSYEEPEGTAKSWTGVDHMALHLVDKAGVKATQTFDPATTVVDFTTDGELGFTLGEQSIPAATWKVELVAVDAAGDPSQLIHWDRDKVEFVVHDTESVT